MRIFCFMFMLSLLAGGCIQIQPRRKTPAPAPGSAAEIRNQVSAHTEAQARGLKLILTQIRRQNIRWEDISRYPAPEQSWREERFRLLRKNGEIRPEDFKLSGIRNLPDGKLEFRFSFLPLRAAYDRHNLWDTQVVFMLESSGEISDIHMYSERIPGSFSGQPVLSASECNSISSAVLKALFRLDLTEKVRAKERFRFCYPVNGADEKFHDHLRPRARIPELDPTEEYPDFPIPSERGRYRSFKHGAFYYYAGIVLPVSSGEVWVFDTAVRYDGGEKHGTCYKLKKKLFFWEVVAEGSYDAFSRAVREKDK